MYETADFTSLSAHTRLYLSVTKRTREERLALFNSYEVSPPTPLSTLRQANPLCSSITRVVGGGPLIVTYPTPRTTPNEKKDSVMTPRGKCRTPFGGFYNS